MALKRNKCPWTPDELAYLEGRAGVVPMSTLTKKLQRTDGAIRNKCWKEGIQLVRDNMYLQFADVARLIGVDNKTVWYWAHLYGMPHKNMNLNFKERPYVVFEELVEWLKNNQDRWKADKLEIYGLGMEYDWLKKKRKKDSSRLDKSHYKLWSDIECTKVYAMLQAGKSWEEIGLALGRSTNPKTIQAALARYQKRKKKELDKDSET